MSTWVSQCSFHLCDTLYHCSTQEGFPTNSCRFLFKGDELCVLIPLHLSTNTLRKSMRSWCPPLCGTAFFFFFFLSGPAALTVSAFFAFIMPILCSPNSIFFSCLKLHSKNLDFTLWEISAFHTVGVSLIICRQKMYHISRWLWFIKENQRKMHLKLQHFSSFLLWYVPNVSLFSDGSV